MNGTNHIVIWGLPQSAISAFIFYKSKAYSSHLLFFIGHDASDSFFMNVAYLTHDCHSCPTDATKFLPSLYQVLWATVAPPRCYTSSDGCHTIAINSCSLSLRCCGASPRGTLWLRGQWLVWLGQARQQGMGKNRAWDGPHAGKRPRWVEVQEVLNSY